MVVLFHMSAVVIFIFKIAVAIGSFTSKQSGHLWMRLADVPIQITFSGKAEVAIVDGTDTTVGLLDTRNIICMSFSVLMKMGHLLEFSNTSGVIAAVRSLSSVRKEVMSQTVAIFETGGENNKINMEINMQK